MTSEMQALVEVMRPQPSPKPLIRLGGYRDGAYLVPDDLEGVSACFSPGVSGVKHFEDELFDAYGIPSHMCDFSSDIKQFKTPLKDGQTFKKLWLDVEGKPNSITLENWVSELAPGSDDLLLQMDIEGAEYRNLLTVPDTVLKRFRIIVVELHRLGAVHNKVDFERELGPLLGRLGKHFRCVHAHPNNCEGEFQVPGTSLNLPRVHELTFLRRDRFRGRKATFNKPQLPHPLDISQNNEGKTPVFLNEHWFEGDRSLASELKLAKDQLAFHKRQQQLMQEAVAEAEIVRADVQAVLTEQKGEPKGASGRELAQGRSFTLSSRHAASPPTNVVKPSQPYLFHTKMEARPRITVDLGQVHVLDSLEISNRADGFANRARQLRYCVHNSSRPKYAAARPVWVTPAFLDGTESTCETRLGSVSGRYITVFSEAYTFLHFSDIKVFGRGRQSKKT